MRIAIDARFITNGSGLGRYTQKLVEYILLLDKENEYTVIVNDDDVQEIQKKYSDCKVVGVKWKHYTIGEQWGYFWWLKKQNFDLVHFTNFNYPIWYHGKFVVTIHDLTLWFYPGRTARRWISEFGYKIAMRSAVQNASTVIAISEFTKRDIIKYLNANQEKVRVVYESADEKIEKVVDSNRLQTVKEKFNLDYPFFLYVGQWRVHKNLVRLVQAFDKIRETGCQTKLLLVGKEDVRYPEVREAISNSKYSNDIVVTGFVSDEELSVLYSMAMVFVFPSLYEGAGLPPLEAMYCGLPVISSDASCMPEMLGRSVLYFDPYNIDEMANTMSQVANDENLRKDLIARGFEQIKKYSWEKMAKETLVIYRRVV